MPENPPLTEAAVETGQNLRIGPSQMGGSGPLGCWSPLGNMTKREAKTVYSI